MNREDSNCVALWACVMLQAIADACDNRPETARETAALARPLRRYLGKKRSLERSSALAWLMRNDHEVSGFLWVCDVVGLEPDVVRARLDKLDGMTIRTLKRNKPLRVHNHDKGDESCLANPTPPASEV